MAKATFAAGKFWSVEDAFRKVKGIVGTVTGYTGGTTENPTPEDVAGGDTGHVEAVEIEYDTRKTDFRQLLELFWTCHDPTQLGRQGRDIGPQFRSVIFYHTLEQKASAEHARAMVVAMRRFPRPVVTAIQPAGPFYPAPEDQQQYFVKHGRPPGPR
jgi:peptide-methionine (S)-S-oxide reductase